MSLDPLQQLVERQAIVDVIYAYCRSVDLVNAEAVAECFADDCTVDYGPGMGTVTRGKENVRDRLGAGLHRFAATSHHVSNIEVTFDSVDSANTITYLYAWHRFADGKPDAHLWAQYHDRFAKVAGRWLIADRVLKVAGQEAFDIPWYPIGRQEK
jgi:ketosteroid isomerase-like protein